jgi:carbamate kinase
MTVENQRENVRLACDHLAPIAEQHELIISHGNGPQIGLLALEEAAYGRCLSRRSMCWGGDPGMIGYLIEQELGNRLPFEKPLASLLTMIEVDPDDPAFSNPSKPIGPQYDKAEADRLAAERGWTFKPDGDRMRRVVPSPVPQRIFEHRPIRWLLDQGCVVICAGGGGIPTIYRPGRQLTGIEAVIDKDRASALLANNIHADILIMATDAQAVFVGFGTPQQRAIVAADPDVLLAEYHAEFAAGSMLPKVMAACEFAGATGKPAVIGALADIDAMLAGTRAPGSRRRLGRHCPQQLRREPRPWPERGGALCRWGRIPK